jgi:hypothetical protein
MSSLRDWLTKHQFLRHGLAFSLMVLAPVPMALAAQQGAVAWVWIFLGVFIFANLLALI